MITIIHRKSEYTFPIRSFQIGEEKSIGMDLCLINGLSLNIVNLSEWADHSINGHHYIDSISSILSQQNHLLASIYSISTLVEVLENMNTKYIDVKPDC